MLEELKSAVKKLPVHDAVKQLGKLKNGVLHLLSHPKQFVAVAAITSVTALGVGSCLKSACSKEHHALGPFLPPGRVDPPIDGQKPSVPEFRVQPSVWDQDPEYHRVVPAGEFSEDEYKSRLITLKNGEKIFKDIGSLTFYRVQEGDDFEAIRSKLAVYDQFKYLQDAPLSKLKSFNIPKKSLNPGILIPIPLPEGDRILSDEQFLNYCSVAIDEILSHPQYGSEVQRMIDKSGKREVMALMSAVAKQESGGKPIGQFEFHRWEPHHSAFSFSLFHVLMKDAGIAARKSLNLTEGQLYHPKNAAKLFLAFLCEKTAMSAKEGPSKFLPIMEHKEQFAVFYNGKAWRKTNPHYCENITQYYQDAQAILRSPETQKNDKVPATVAPKVPQVDSPDTLVATSADFNALKSYCLKTPGGTAKNCEPVSRFYPQNERMLGKVMDKKTTLDEEQVARLQDYYCDKMTALIDQQYAGKAVRPKGKRWRQSLAERQQKLDAVCREE